MMCVTTLKLISVQLCHPAVMQDMETLQAAACQAAFSNCIWHRSVGTVPETMPFRLSKRFSSWEALP